MTSKLRRVFVQLLTATLFPAAFCLAAGPQAPPTVLEHVRLIDGTGRPPVENAVVVIEGQTIRAAGREGSVAVPPGAKRLDLAGKTVMPLLICLHGHLGQTLNGAEGSPDSYTRANVQAQLEHYLRYGVGAMISLGTDQDFIYELRAAQRAGRLGGARVYTAGRGFGVVGGFPPGQARPHDVYRPKTPEEARADVRELAAHHPDFVKLWVDDDFARRPKMRPEIYRAIIDEAHREHLRALAHVFYLDDAKGLVAAGVDGLAHSVRDKPVDSALIQSMKARGVFLTPTLVRDESTFAYAQGAPWLDDPFFQAGVSPDVLKLLTSPSFQSRFGANPDLARSREAFEMAKRNLKTLFDAGVAIGLGTDSGPPLRFQGYFEHRELQLMVSSGLTPMEALTIATGRSAKLLGASDLGTLEPGKRADFMVLDANPLVDIRNTEKVSAVWQAGRPVRPINAP